MSAWCALRRGQEVRDPRAWLFTIAHRSALRASQRPGSPVDELDEAPARARSPEEQIEQSGRVRATLAAVAGLPPRERDALVWASIQGRSGRDIARALGVSEAAARQLVFRARARASRRERARATGVDCPPPGLWRSRRSTRACACPRGTGQREPDGGERGAREARAGACRGGARDGAGGRGRAERSPGRAGAHDERLGRGPRPTPRRPRSRWSAGDHPRCGPRPGFARSGGQATEGAHGCDGAPEPRRHVSDARPRRAAPSAGPRR